MAIGALSLNLLGKGEACFYVEEIRRIERPLASLRLPRWSR